MNSVRNASSIVFKKLNLPYVLILVFIYLLSYTGKAFNLKFFKSSILVQIYLYFCNNFTSSIRKGSNLLILFSNLNVLTYPILLGIIKTNGLTYLSKYPIKYLGLVFDLTNFKIGILST